ncbi:hypothetical protein CYR32_17800 [Chimaeribacter coloradensis]|uniref:Uncharacterized protein n=1 Tax=Chimaeribacter coloradensis TaxID=2060068 RepID=A0A2N5DV34_9GAMM|nr:hypothetical protein CYR32_17800 [Chimaeribacter coloradensis]
MSASEPPAPRRAGPAVIFRVNSVEAVTLLGGRGFLARLLPVIGLPLRAFSAKHPLHFPCALC